MKLDYIADGSDDCPMIRLYDFTPDEAGHLRAVLADLAAGVAGRVEVHNLPWVEPVGGCRLTLVRRSWDQAVVRGAGPTDLECGFAADTWDRVAGLVEPFALGGGGFQWLAAAPGEARLLLSVSGQW